MEVPPKVTISIDPAPPDTIILNFSLKPLSLHKLNCISVKQSGKFDVFLLDLHYLAKT